MHAVQFPCCREVLKDASSNRDALLRRPRPPGTDDTTGLELRSWSLEVPAAH